MARKATQKSDDDSDDAESNGKKKRGKIDYIFRAKDEAGKYRDLDLILNTPSDCAKVKAWLVETKHGLMDGETVVVVKMITSNI